MAEVPQTSCAGPVTAFLINNGLISGLEFEHVYIVVLLTKMSILTLIISLHLQINLD